MPKIADSIRLNLTTGSVEIDGEPFPYYLANTTIGVEQVAPDGMTAVTLTIYADRCDVDMDEGDERNLISSVSYRRAETFTSEIRRGSSGSD